MNWTQDEKTNWKIGLALGAVVCTLVILGGLSRGHIPPTHWVVLGLYTGAVLRYAFGWRLLTRQK